MEHNSTQAGACPAAVVHLCLHDTCVVMLLMYLAPNAACSSRVEPGACISAASIGSNWQAQSLCEFTAVIVPALVLYILHFPV